MFSRQDIQLITIGVFSVVASVFIIIAGGKLNERFTVSQVPSTPATEPSMHLFAYNKCSPACCTGSPYSCSGGCVCMNEAQRLAITTRGNNAATQPPDMLI